MATITRLSDDPIRKDTSSGFKRIVMLCLSLPAGAVLLVFLPLLLTSFVVCGASLSLIGKLTGEPPRKLNLVFDGDRPTV